MAGALHLRGGTAIAFPEPGAEADVVLGLGSLVAAASVGSLLARKLGLPGLAGYLAGGFLVGPGLGLAPGALARPLGAFAVTLLLFLAGLEVPSERGGGRARGAVPAALGQVAATMAAGAVLAMALGHGIPEAAVVGLALAFSSTAVVVKLLLDSGKLREVLGGIVVTVLLVQDAIVALSLGFFPLQAEGGTVTAAARSAVGLAAAIAVALAARRLALPRALALLGRPALLLASLAWLLGFVLGGETVGVPREAGAFLAGIALTGSAATGEIRRRVRPVLDLFLAVYFASTAAAIDGAGAAAAAPEAVAFALFALLAKPPIFAAFLAPFRHGPSLTFEAALSLGQLSEFSIVLATAASAAGAIPESTATAITLATLAAMVVSAVALQRVEALLGGARRLGLHRLVPQAREGAPGPRPRPEGHVVVFGWNPIAEAVVDALARDPGRRILVVAPEASLVPPGIPEGVEHVFAAPDELASLREAAVERAALIVIALSEPGPSLLLIDRFGARVPVVARADTPAVARRLLDAGAAAVLAPHEMLKERVLDLLGVARG